MKSFERDQLKNFMMDFKKGMIEFESSTAQIWMMVFEETNGKSISQNKPL